MGQTESLVGHVEHSRGCCWTTEEVHSLFGSHSCLAFNANVVPIKKQTPLERSTNSKVEIERAECCFLVL